MVERGKRRMTICQWLKQLIAIGIFTSLFIISILSVSAGTGNPAASSNAFKRDSLKVGGAAPSFVMRDLITDNPVFMRDYSGETLRDSWKNKNRYVIVLSFWATWCQPCKVEIPLLEKIAEEMKNEPIKFFLINTMEKSEQNEDSIRQVYMSRGYKMQCLLDPATRFAQLYTVHGLPMLVVIDKFGIVRKINRGYNENFDIELEKLLKELVKEEGSKKK
jgi:thiol-disulfide isomerase/thioredoxin